MSLLSPTNAVIKQQQQSLNIKQIKKQKKTELIS